MGRVTIEVMRPVGQVSATVANGIWTCSDPTFLFVLNTIPLAPGYYPNEDLARASRVLRFYGGKITEGQDIERCNGDVELEGYQ